uniref:Uncharacterized protein n=1 Tax=Ixodes ricinus TaxID=34613 RepID=A0A6B0UCE5_IXORI
MRSSTMYSILKFINKHIKRMFLPQKVFLHIIKSNCFGFVMKAEHNAFKRHAVTTCVDYIRLLLEHHNCVIKDIRCASYRSTKHLATIV